MPTGLPGPADVPELVPLAEAAHRADRSVTAVRRWLRLGKLTRHEGVPPAHGGSPPVLVDTRELAGLLLTEGKQPHAWGRSRGLVTTDVQVSTEPGTGGHDQPSTGVRPFPGPAAGELARLREQVAVAAAESDARELRVRLTARCGGGDGCSGARTRGYPVTGDVGRERIGG
jgi:hypothetical protein